MNRTNENLLFELEGNILNVFGYGNFSSFELIEIIIIDEIIIGTYHVVKFPLGKPREESEVYK